MSFEKGLIFFNQKYASQKELLGFISKKFSEKEVVTEGFMEALQKREKEFPTGLRAEVCGVAIPHADSFYVNQDQLCFISLSEPISFGEMGTDGQVLAVKLVFAMALKEPHAQIDMLQQLTAIFQDQSIMQSLVDCQSEQAFLELINQRGIK